MFGAYTATIAIAENEASVTWRGSNLTRGRILML